MDRFVDAQANGVHERAVREIRAGRKDSHWMWFVFPQLVGLGRSETARYFALASLTDAQAYLAHAVLGPRLHEAVAATLDVPPGRFAEDVFGPIDAVKLRSSMTLFHRAAPDEPLFSAVLARFYGGEADAATDALLRQPS